MRATKQQRARIFPILKRADFLRVQSNERKWIAKGFVLQVSPIPPDAPITAKKTGQKIDQKTDKQAVKADIIRCGFTVTKRTDKAAVRRNRIKRRLRAVAADVLSSHACGGYDYVLIGRRETLDLPYITLCKDLRWCLRKMDLYQEDAQMPAPAPPPASAAPLPVPPSSAQEGA